jgi:hypothetical protein
MIYEPGHGNPLHPGANKGYTLSTEKKPVVPVFQRSEYDLESIRFIFITVHLWYIKTEL